jgi:crotonobetaine/carnitine-CoA ligase
VTSYLHASAADPRLRTLYRALSAGAEAAPDAALVSDDAGTLTREGAHEVARRVGAGLQRIGVKQHETVGVMLANRREFLEAWFGLAAAGGIEVPINTELIGDRLVHILNHSECELVVAAADAIDAIDAVADRLTSLERIAVVGEGSSDHFQVVPWAEVILDAGPWEPPRVSFSDPVAVMYTSGSTGPAKGAILSHGHHWTNGFQGTSVLDIGSSDVLYCCLPLYHNMAQGYGVWPALISGAAVRVGPRFQAATFWEEIRACDATILSFVGAMLVLLAKQPPSPHDGDNNLRIGFGVPIPKQIHEEFEARFGLELVHCYGSTEATMVAWNHGFSPRALGAAGRPQEGHEVVILDDLGRQAPSGATGEICVRPRQPASMFSGYWRDPDRTVVAWRDLWFHTGDRGRLDEDGNLWFVDRMDDVIRRMGEFISSTEVEQAVLANPRVLQVAAFGVPSELGEEEVMVAVVPAADAGSLSAAELRDWCADQLPRFAVPRFVDICEQLPMTTTGKLEKYKLRARGVTASTFDARAAVRGTPIRG